MALPPSQGGTDVVALPPREVGIPLRNYAFQIGRLIKEEFKKEDPPPCRTTCSAISTGQRYRHAAAGATIGLENIGPAASVPMLNGGSAAAMLVVEPLARSIRKRGVKAEGSEGARGGDGGRHHRMHRRWLRWNRARIDVG